MTTQSKPKTIYYECPGCGMKYPEHYSPNNDQYGGEQFGSHCLKCDTYVTQIYEVKDENN